MVVPKKLVPTFLLLIGLSLMVDLSYLQRQGVVLYSFNLFKIISGVFLIIFIKRVFKDRYFLKIICLLAVLSLYFGIVHYQHDNLYYDLYRIFTQFMIFISSCCIVMFLRETDEQKFLNVVRNLIYLFVIIGWIDIAIGFSGDRLAGVSGEPKMLATISSMFLLLLGRLNISFIPKIFISISLVLFIYLSESATALIILCFLLIFNVSNRIRGRHILYGVLGGITLFILFQTNERARERFALRISNKFTGQVQENQLSIGGVGFEANDVPIANEIYWHPESFVIGYGLGSDALIAKRVLFNYSYLEMFNPLVLNPSYYYVSNIPLLRIIPQIGIFGLILYLFRVKNIGLFKVHSDIKSKFVQGFFLIGLLFLPMKIHFLALLFYRFD